MNDYNTVAGLRLQLWLWQNGWTLRRPTAHGYQRWAKGEAALELPARQDHDDYAADVEAALGVIETADGPAVDDLFTLLTA